MMKRHFNDSPPQFGLHLRLTSQQRKDTARKRWGLLNRFVDEGLADLNPSDSSVWMTLFRHAGADGRATVARAVLEKKTGRDAKTVTAALSRLCAKGWLVREQRGGPSGGVAVYRVQPTDSGGGKNG